MNSAQLAELATNSVLRGRLAKLIALESFRNSELEDLHAGKFPSSQIGDYSDVEFVSPYGEIAWNDLSRLDDDEMKALMIDVVNRCDQFLAGLFVSARGQDVVEALKHRDPVPKWNDPENAGRNTRKVTRHRKRRGEAA
jgi:hypothetical protein